MRINAWFDDAASPILVKEVRQSLRGRFFGVGFFSTLVIAAVVSFLQLGFARIDDENDNIGPRFFAAVFSCLAGAVSALVPFIAFQSMGGEWEENTMDLLELSNLRPRQIIRGKIFSAMIIVAMFFSAFVPFLAIGFMLGGIDVVAAAFVIAAMILYSICLVTIAVATSTVAKQRIWRYILAFIVAILLVLAAVAGAAMGNYILRAPSELRGGEFWQVTAIVVAAGIIITRILYDGACARLSHPEENASTGPRVFLVISLLTWMVVTERIYYWDHKHETLFLSAYWAFVFLYFVFSFLTTESERLGRRARSEVPKDSFHALLSIPFLPGGGRAVILFMFMIAAVVGSVVVIDEIHPGYADSTRVASAGLYLFNIICLPGAFLAVLTKRINLRIGARGLLLLVTILVIFGPMLWGAIVQSRTLLTLRHFGNPAYIVYRADKSDDPIILLTLIIISFVTVIANSPRIIDGCREVFIASHDRAVNAKKTKQQNTKKPTHAEAEPGS